jgi:hypothetical protein
VVNSQLAKFASQMSFSFTDLAHTLLYERWIYACRTRVN